MKTALQLLHDVKTYVPPSEFYRSELPTMTPPGGIAWQKGGLCPFHEDHYQGSFHVHLKTGAFHCFSCGAKGGDIIAFTQLRYAVPFQEAVEKLANEWGV